MKKLLASIICFSLSALIVVAGGDAKTTPKVEGSWTAISAISKGKKLPDEVITKVMLVVTFKEGKYGVTIMGKEIEAGTYKVDAKKKPAEIDMTITEGQDKGKMQLAIFKIEADTATFAIGKAGSTDRPKNFEGGEDIEITVLKRNK